MPETIVIDEQIVTSWLTVADSREKPPWDQVESLLDELQKRHPWRARMARQYIRWLRNEALSYHISWGKSLNGYENRK